MSCAARRCSAYADDGTRMKRYLPENAWDLLGEKEEKQAKKAKQRGDQKGKQFVENTAAAKAARAYVDHGDASDLSADQLDRLTKDDLMQIARKHDISGRSKMRKSELVEAIDRHFHD